jgi:pyruvate kinase
MDQIKKKTDPMIDLELHSKYLHFRRTKIVATIGPASNTASMMKLLIEAGLNVARINFSHGTHEEHLASINLLRQVSDETGKSIAILGDLCGPKIRVGKFKNDAIELIEGSEVIITTEEILGEPGLIPSQYKNLPDEIKDGHRILLDDGNLELQFLNKVDKYRIRAKVMRGGKLKNNKGMNLPDTKMNISALSVKDKEDAVFAIGAGVDYIALSFVRYGKDITELRDLIKQNNSDIPIIAKIEKPEALENIHEIISLADGMMIARGDLGVELPPQKVPILQSRLVQIANEYNKPVIVATQMLESMIEHGTPTRAEATDVASACMHGTDAVMLSAETAAGKYPVEAIRMMETIIRETETYQFFAHGAKFKRYGARTSDKLHNAIGAAITQLSIDLMVRAVFVVTKTGYTARIISSDRPSAPILTFAVSKNVRQRLNLLWGIYPYAINDDTNAIEHINIGEEYLKKLELANTGDYTLFVSSISDRINENHAIMVHQVN